MVRFETKKQVQKWPFFVLWFLCILGSWSILPYGLHLGVFSSSVSFAKMFLLITIQSTLLFGIICTLSYWLVRKTDLNPFSIHKPLKKMIYLALLAGIAVGFILYLLDRTLFESSLLSGVHPPAWTGFLASFYGAINEEVLLRLFLFTLIYFLFRKICRFESKGRNTFLWVTNVIVAIIFGLGHLPAAFKITTPSSFEIFRVLLLNGIPGVVFGWLYFSRGLLAAMIAHFVTDLCVHVFAI